MDRYVSTYYDSMDQNDNGDWVRYEDAATRIAELEAQLAAERENTAIKLAAISVAAGSNTRESAKANLLSDDNQYYTAAYGDVVAAIEREMDLREQLAAKTSECDSETAWAKEYSDKADKLEAQLAAEKELQSHANCHDVVCNGSRHYPRGYKGIGCSCSGRDTAYLELAAAQEQMTASESVYGFVAWLTTRKEVVSFGASRDAAPACDLVKQWCDANTLSGPREGVYPDNITMPDSSPEADHV